MRRRASDAVAQPLQTAVVCALGVGLIGLAFGAVLSADETALRHLLDGLDRYRVPASLVALIACIAVDRQRIEGYRQRWQHGWLRAMSVPAQFRAQAIGLVLTASLLRLAALWGCGALLDVRIGSGPQPLTLLSLSAAVLLSLPITGWLTRRAPARDANSRVAAHAPSRAAERHPRRLAHWSLLRCLAGMRSRAAALWLAPGLLLIPGGQSIGGSAALLLLFVGTACGIAGWRAGIALQLEARGWLQTQPIATLQLLRPLIGVPLAMVSGCAMLGAIGLTTLGVAPALAGGAVGVVCLIALLHAACVAAAWRTPWRAGATFAALLVLLALLLRDLPPAAPVAALWCIAWQLHRARRA